jgi:hypothetical protein
MFLVGGVDGLAAVETLIVSTTVVVAAMPTGPVVFNGPGLLDVSAHTALLTPKTKKARAKTKKQIPIAKNHRGTKLTLLGRMGFGGFCFGR